MSMPLTESGMSYQFRLVLFFTLIHIPLGVLMYSAGTFALLHPAAVFGIGLYWASQKNVGLERVSYAVAYLVGAEVLWRMANVPVFWEFGKYGSAAIVAVALIRRRHYQIPKLPLAYFILLLPGAVLTFVALDLNGARDILSSNMSGPISLLLCCWFFSYVKVTPAVLRHIFLSLIIPLFSIACATLFYTVTVENIQFNSESNFATSGGFGPNQVSAILGLGSLIALMNLVIFRNSTTHRIYFVVAAILFTAQSVMTFSRGGIYNAAGALAVVLLVQFRSPGAAARKLIPVALVVIIFLVVVFPALNSFTGGNLQERFEDTGTTNRSEIIESDIAIFWEKPLLGVGVGMAYGYREKFLAFKAMSHTEFTRMIAEHGVLGVLSILCLLAILVINVRRQNSMLGKAAVAGVGVWCVLFMMNSGMRLAAPSFLLGLTYITLVRHLAVPGATRPKHILPAFPTPRRRSKGFSSSERS